MMATLTSRGASSSSWSVLLVAVVLVAQCSADLAEQRHNVPPPNRSAEMEYPASINSALMLSPCRPEKDGYFGGTYGDPAVLQYAFEMETDVNNAETSEALATVREHVMDVTVAATFPAVCSFRDLSASVALHDMKAVSGFQFGQDYDAVRKCQCTTIMMIVLCLESLSANTHIVLFLLDRIVCA